MHLFIENRWRLSPASDIFIIINEMTSFRTVFGENLNFMVMALDAGKKSPTKVNKLENLHGSELKFISRFSNASQSARFSFFGVAWESDTSEDLAD